MGLWEAGRLGQLALLGQRDLDICLMRRERRTVYRSGYIQFANLTYQGEHLGGYAGESVIVRYDPRDITTIWIYQLRNGKEEFLTRAHAQGLETEMLSYGEAQAMSRRLRSSGQAVTNRSVLNEVRDKGKALASERDAKLLQLRRAHQGNAKSRGPGRKRMAQRQEEFQREERLLGRESRNGTLDDSANDTMAASPFETSNQPLSESKSEQPIANDDNELKKPIKPVRVYANYEEIEREARSK